MATYQEYPKLMKHPQHAAPIMKKLEGKGVGLFEPDTICTSPERYPDVTVTTLEQEQYYAARGYRPPNVGDAAQYEQAILESKPVEGYAFSEYPKWKYHPIELPVIVKTAAEEQSLGAGWEDKPVIATEDDLEDEEVPVVNGSEVAHEVVAKATPAARKANPAVKKTAAKKPIAKVDKRTKEYKQAHA